MANSKKSSRSSKESKVDARGSSVSEPPGKEIIDLVTSKSSDSPVPALKQSTLANCQQSFKKFKHGVQAKSLTSELITPPISKDSVISLGSSSSNLVEIRQKMN